MEERGWGDGLTQRHPQAAQPTLHLAPDSLSSALPTATPQHRQPWGWGQGGPFSPSKSSMVFSSFATDLSANSARVSACQGSSTG